MVAQLTVEEARALLMRASYGGIYFPEAADVKAYLNGVGKIATQLPEWHSAPANHATNHATPRATRERNQAGGDRS